MPGKPRCHSRTSGRNWRAASRGARDWDRFTHGTGPGPVRTGAVEVEDLTDNERAEQLRRWWSENWLWIVGGVALGLALLWGWQYWQQRQMQQAQAEEAAYSAVLDLLGAQKFDEAVAKGKSL